MKAVHHESNPEEYGGSYSEAKSRARKNANAPRRPRIRGWDLRRQRVNVAVSGFTLSALA